MSGTPLSARVPRFGLVAIAVPVLALASASCGSGPSPPATKARPTLELSACAPPFPTNARCGALTVLENPARPDGRRVSLRVVVVPAYGSGRAADPLFYFAGGPGGAATDDQQWASSTFAALNARRDLVFVDQRGTGGSNRMECPELGNIEEGGDTSMADIQAKAARACLASTAQSGDPAMYTTPLFADDIDQVRSALGYETIDLYGVSYGVSSGLAYIQRHGEHVRTAVFDSGSLLDVRLWEASARSEQAALRSVLARCALDAACRTAYPNGEAELTAVAARLAAGPIGVDISDPRTGGSSHVTVDLTTFGELGAFLGNVFDQARVPAIIHQAYLGDWARLIETVAAAQPPSDPKVTLVMARTIRCSDQWARMDPAAIRAVGTASIFTAHEAAMASMQQQFCAAWPQARGASGTVHTGAPVVFLNGTADPADPPANVAGATATMPNSLVVPVTAYGHGQLSQDPSGCLTIEVSSFIENGVPSKAADWPCAQTPPLPPFVVP